MNAIQWVEETEDQFHAQLGVLPPAAMGGAGFQVGEASDHVGGRPTFETHMERDGKFFVANDPMTFAQFKQVFPTAEYYYGE